MRTLYIKFGERLKIGATIKIVMGIKIMVVGGILLSEPWHNFETFFEENNLFYTEGLTIDRIDNNKGYSFENCTWATPKQQARNRRNNRLVLMSDGTHKCLAELCEEYRVGYSMVGSRLKKGIDPFNALFKPSYRTNTK
jgi:hypothetical protein